MHTYVFSGKKHNGAAVFHDECDSEEWIFLGDDGCWQLNTGKNDFTARLRGPCRADKAVFIPDGDANWTYVQWASKDGNAWVVEYDLTFLDKLSRLALSTASDIVPAGPLAEIAAAVAQREREITIITADARSAALRHDIEAFARALEVGAKLGRDVVSQIVGVLLRVLATDLTGDGLDTAFKAGANPNITDIGGIRDGRTMLHHVAALGSFELADQLLRNPLTNVNAVSVAGRTPLHEAVYNSADSSESHIKIVKLLISRGAQVEIKDTDGATALILAAENVRSAAALLLVEHGANVTVQRPDGKSILRILDDAGKYQQSSKDLAHAIRRVLVGKSLAQRLAGPWAEWKNENAAVRKLVADGRVNIVFSIAVDDPRGRINNTADANIERVRVGKWDILSDTYFDHSPDVNTGAPDATLYTALVYTSAAISTRACSASDVKEQLDAYETGLSAKLIAGDICRVNPLYFLAHARHAQLLSGETRRLCLLREFQQRFPDLAASIDAGGWLNEGEVAVLHAAVAEVADNPADARPGKLLAAALPASELSPSAATATVEERWNLFKGHLAEAQREPMEELLQLTGLAAVKECTLQIYRGVLADAKLIAEGHSESVGERNLNFAFMGNPGTGKSTVGKLFAKLLAAAGARAGHKYIERKASHVIRMGSSAFAAELATLTGGPKSVAPPPTEIRRGMAVEVRIVQDGDSKWYPAKALVVHDDGTVDVEYTNGEVDEKVNPDGFEKVRPIGIAEPVGGVLFIDEAYDLDPANNKVGAEILNEIMAAAEDHRDKISIILAGYRQDVEQKLFAYNIGMPRRFIDVSFDDFDYDQLHQIFCSNLTRTGWTAEPKVARVAARRVARGIGSKSFGNAGDVRKLFNAALERAKQDYFSAEAGAPRIMTVEHVIGKRPSVKASPQLRTALAELHGKTGLASIKEEINGLIALTQNNYDKELRGEDIDAVPLNRLFLGNPGTGKTTIAILYGRILAALGLLSKGGILDRKASDFKGSFIGQSEKQTNTILEMAQGNVLLIDEAYALDDGKDSGKGGYGSIVLDTIVEKVQGRPGEDVAVILAGYEAEMMKMLRDQNPGLARRFNPDSALRFRDFTDLELLSILSAECDRTCTRASFAVKRAAVKHLARRRALPNFGNAGAVKSMLADAKRRMVARSKAIDIDSKDYQLEVVDFVGEQDAVAADPLLLLDDLEAVGDFKYKLERLGQQIMLRRQEGAPSDSLVTNYIFTGEPGTGKTTVARKMGAILYAYGILVRPDVIVTTGEGMTGEYVGQTKKNVEAKMQAARGGVLFVDEAYDLGHGKFGQEAMSTLLAMLTEPDYKGKTVVVLAGYKDEMHSMLARNPGMKSRFKPSGYVDFPNWEASRCVDVVVRRATTAIPTPFTLDEAALQVLHDGFNALRERPGWANARDAESMFDLLTEARGDRLTACSKVEDPRTITVADARSAVAAFVSTRPAIVEEQPELAGAELMRADVARAPRAMAAAWAATNPASAAAAAPPESAAGAQQESESIEDESSDSDEKGDVREKDDNLPTDDPIAMKEVFSSLFKGVGKVTLPGHNGLDVLNAGGPLRGSSFEKLLEQEARSRAMSKMDFIEHLLREGAASVDARHLIDDLVSQLVSLGYVSQGDVSLAKRESERAVKRWMAAQKEARRLREVLEARLRDALRTRMPVYICGVCSRPWGVCTFMGPVLSHYVVEEASDDTVRRAADAHEANSK